MLFAPVIEKRLQARQALAVFRSVRRLFARDDICRTTHRKSFDIDPSLPGVFKPLDTIRREHQIEIEGSVLELDDVLAALNLRMLRIGQLEAQLYEGGDDRGSVGGGLFDEQIGVLCRVRIAPDSTIVPVVDQGISISVSGSTTVTDHECSAGLPTPFEVVAPIASNVSVTAAATNTRSLQPSWPCRRAM
jgi:hypothetical protein